MTIRAALASLGIAAVLLLTACAPTEGLADSQPEDVADQGFISGDGSYELIAQGERLDPIPFSGTTERGEQLSSEELAGEVTVVNFWYAACPPCRLEASDLEALNQEHAADGVNFVGVNIYDQAPTALSFAESFGITYPSILDVQEASVRLAFSANVSPQAIPSTLVLDRDGRVAAVFRGPINKSILGTMITDTAAESGS